jgi:hypothetical protein
MILFRAVSTIRAGESPEIVLPFIVPYDLSSRSCKVIVNTPASALKEQLSSGLETALYILEHCQVILDPVQTGK